jgi:hypothetical protein
MTYNKAFKYILKSLSGMRSGKISFGYRVQRDFGSFAASAMRPFEGSGRDQDRLDLGRNTGSSTPLKLKMY